MKKKIILFVVGLSFLHLVGKNEQTETMQNATPYLRDLFIQTIMKNRNEQELLEREGALISKYKKEQQDNYEIFGSRFVAANEEETIEDFYAKKENIKVTAQKIRTTLEQEFYLYLPANHWLLHDTIHYIASEDSTFLNSFDKEFNSQDEKVRQRAQKMYSQSIIDHFRCAYGTNTGCKQMSWFRYAFGKWAETKVYGSQNPFELN